MRRRFMNYSMSIDYSNYLTIEAIEDVSALFSIEVQWTTNGRKWETGKRVIAKAGQLVSIKRNSMQGETIFASWNEGAYNLRGNIMSLLFGDDAKGKTSMLGYSLSGLFQGSNVITVEKGFLPATTLADNCYNSMFYGCTSLTTAPELPATTLVSNCYGGMFQGCTSLTTSPELPATTLASNCYGGMFQGCTSLVDAPELPAMTLATFCYNSMFYGCTNLVNAPELPATTLTNYCYSQMFYECSKLNYIKMLATDISAVNCLINWVKGVASTGTFVKNPAMTTLPTATSDNGYAGIPSGWTVVNDREE